MICEECKKECERRSPRQKYCPKCRTIIRKKQKKIRCDVWKKKNKKFIQQYRKDYRKENKAVIRKWKTENKEHILKYERDHRKRNPEKYKWYDKNRRARMNNIIHDFSSKEWLQKLKDTFGVCPKCNKFVGIENLTLDHIHPISKAKDGQIYTIDDVQPMCKSCNCSKGAKC